MKIDECCMNNGDGLRVVLWLSGCEHACENCHNKETWNHNAGTKFTEAEFTYLVSLLNQNHIAGLTITGGDPLHTNSAEEVMQLVSMIKESVPEKNIWLWTGYELKDVFYLPNITKVDVLIDGRYDYKKPTKKKWRGSDNQKMYKSINNRFTLID